MVSLDLTMSVEKPLCFGKLMIPMVKDKKSFLHGVHKNSRLHKEVCCFFYSLPFYLLFVTRQL